MPPVGDLVEEVVEVEVARFDPHLAFLDLGEIEEVGQQVHERMARRGDRLHVTLALVVEVRELEELGEAHDGVERRPDLVAHGGEEAGLRAACLLGLADAFAELAAGLHRLAVVEEDGEGAEEPALAVEHEGRGVDDGEDAAVLRHDVEFGAVAAAGGAEGGVDGVVDDSAGGGREEVAPVGSGEVVRVVADEVGPEAADLEDAALGVGRLHEDGGVGEERLERVFGGVLPEFDEVAVHGSPTAGDVRADYNQKVNGRSASDA